MTEPHNSQLTEADLFDSNAANQAFAENRIIVFLREVLQEARGKLIEQFEAGANIKTLIMRRAWLLDQVLNLLWQHHLADSQDISLVAVGGYGRGELNLNSDIDILLLLRNGSAAALKDNIEAFLTNLWDIGLEVGQSVRTIKECVENAKQDITIATNLMEARTIAGADDLREKMQEATGPERIWPGDLFFKAKLEEQEARHNKHNNTEYNLEPNLKTAPGGLRDIQTIGWVAKRHFGVETLSELIDKDFINANEYSILNAGQQFLWRVRFALHAITNRDENRLLFDHQQAVAKLLGYEDTEASLAVEQFMQRYYRAAIAIAQLNEMLLQYFDELILNAKEKVQITPINSRFQIRNGYIEVCDESVFRNSPQALIEIFVLCAQNAKIKGIRAQTIRLIRDNKHLIDDQFRNDIRNISLFIELLRSPFELYTQLRRMKRYGVLGLYIPSFGKIIGKMQYDLFHIYTVDAHSLLVVRNMRRLRLPESREQFPIASRIIHQLPKIELLYLAGLFHDMAKGRGGDHSELGSVDAKEFCLHHRLNNWDANLVSWLVANHLLMSVTAQKKDVSDPDVIIEFANKVGDQIRLDYLYALTVADICATNPSLWNGWRASLMRQLYTETKRAMRRGLENHFDKQELIDQTRQQALILLRRKDIIESDVKDIWDRLSDDYFLRHSAMEVAWHAESILLHKNPHKPLVIVREFDSRSHEGATEIFVYTEDKPNLFAATAAVLDQMGLTILDARIITSESNFSLDTYIVNDESGRDINSDPARIMMIKEALIETLSHPEEFPDVVQRLIPRELKNFPVQTEVIISNDINLGSSIVEVRALDRPGLLAQIGRIFAEYQLSITSARIATLGERAEDVFFVTDVNQHPLADPQLCENLRQSLKSALDPQELTTPASITF